MPSNVFSMRSFSFLAVISATLVIFAIFSEYRATAADAPSPKEQSEAILHDSGIAGGLVIHIGCRDGRLTAALHAGDQYLVHGLAFDAEDVDQARKTIFATGDYGPVSVDQFDGLHLPYIDGLANLVVAEEPDQDLAAEAMRVLAPGGVAYFKRNGEWTKTIKPRPDNIDDWTHFLHDASGNAVAHDDVVGPPRRLQWVGSPRWSRHHDRMSSLSAMVSTGGRIFYIMDEGSRTSIQLPAKWTVIARDAFNGTVLWKKPISHWSQHLWPLKSGPTQLARRLVAVDDTVFVTLGVKAPLSALAASSGKTLRTYAESDGVEEVIFHDGVLFLLVNKGSAELDNFKPKLNVGDQARVREEYHWNEQARQVMAYDAASGRHLWTVKTRVAPLTLSAGNEGVFFHDGEKVVCLQRATGEEIWSSPPVGRRQAITMNFGPKLVIYQGVAFFAGGDRKMTAYDAASGKKLWTAPHAQSGYQSPEDLLIASGLVWNAPTTSTRDTGIFTGRDPRTGEIKKEFPPNVDTYWFHHRCYIAKATDRFLLPSRTGIEFVDHEKEDWNINHWVRGSCLYGIMPCNGLVYAPPHNCACYPEAKLFGLNALAPKRAKPYDRPDAGPRLEPGPAFSDPLPLPKKLPLAEKEENADWPTYRGNDARSGYSKTSVPANLKAGWETTLGGKLSSVVVADGKLFVAQVDAHTVHALDAQTGKPVWRKTVGGRIDSPPTISRGRAFFGAADGYVYCLRASDGELIWRFRAAPYDMRLPAYEQLESVWPVHGSLLVQGDFVYAVAGRSNFLDGGLRFLKLDIKYGKLLAEAHVDETDPTTGKNIQSRLQVLNMPVGLPDILSSDGKSIFMRSQKFDGEGQREGLGPHSGSPAEQGFVQRGDEAHLFAPLGFLDDSMFHRSYWVYGRSFAGGHSGYFQAGKYAPSGRILVFDENNVYGFGRKANYYRWTTILEHQLFSAPKEAPQAPAPAANKRGKGKATFVNVANSKSLNPSNQEISAIAWATSDKPNGVILAHGGPADGYALFLRQGKPQFAVRSNNKLVTIGAAKKQQGKWFHVAGVLSEDKSMRLYVNGKLVATGKAPALVSQQPAQALQIGADDGSAVGSYQSPNGLTGKVDEVRIHHRALSEKEIATRYQQEVDGRAAPQGDAPQNDALALAMSFDKGKAADASPNNNRGVVQGARVTSGKIGAGLRFVRGRGGAPATPNSYVKHHWAQDEPMFIRAMVKAGDTLFIAGPADIINEETSFQKLTEGDPEIQVQLARQDEIMSGKFGSLLHAVSAVDGRKIGQFKLPSAPVWDGMAAAGGRIYLTTINGQVLCLQGK